MNNLRWSALLLLVVAAAAQGQYKYVGPDGTVTYSDQPPPASVKNVEVRNFATGVPTASLPFELRQAVARFPVTLYTTGNCTGCDDARKYMRARGIPYTEKTVTTQEDLDALKKVAKEGILPVLLVGRQKTAGFAEAAWGSMLDDAGYPSRSVMPGSYQNPAPEPLVPLVAAPGSNTADSRGTPPPVSGPPPPPAGDAPPGFRF